MMPVPGIPRDIVEKDFLSSEYDFVTYICRRNGVERERTLELLKEKRNRAIKTMVGIKIPEKKIKKALKDAADEQKKYLIRLGINPEELY